MMQLFFNEHVIFVGDVPAIKLFLLAELAETLTDFEELALQADGCTDYGSLAAMCNLTEANIKLVKAWEGGELAFNGYSVRQADDADFDALAEYDDAFMGHDFCDFDYE